MKRLKLPNNQKVTTKLAPQQNKVDEATVIPERLIRLKSPMQSRMMRGVKKEELDSLVALHSITNLHQLENICVELQKEVQKVHEVFGYTAPADHQKLSLGPMILSLKKCFKEENITENRKLIDYLLVIVNAPRCFVFHQRPYWHPGVSARMMQYRCGFEAIWELGNRRKMIGKSRYVFHWILRSDYW